ncbi:MAG: LysM peptidoglycan-binding domain-containing protein, partial [candidate division Zixibacteria bacterium]|nr:LysM peptidoglycan-binding domain-containing protein [candidate division Zixibacteria bacterium]
MRKVKRKIVWFVLFCLLLAGCSREIIKPQIPESYPFQPEPQLTSQADSSAVYEKLISEELKEAEGYYALGVEANRNGKWEEAQTNFEKALDLLANLDLEEETHSKNIDKYNRLLREIAADYKITLLSLGALDNEGSISAFLEKFDNIQDFQKLQDSIEDSVKVAMEVRDTFTYDMPIEWNERVENSILYLQTVGRERFITYLYRSGKYINLIKEILKEKNLPSDLAYLPLIESGFNSKARSWANAVGMWQFIPSTGRLYGLKSNWWYDEKRYFVKSTYAACDYLSKLYKEFGAWNLALAAYNCGEGGLNRAIKKYKTNNFWELNLRKQTYDYVPLYIAATIIAKNPEKYGLEVEYEKPIEFDTVIVDKPIDLKTIAEVLSVSVEEIRELNPELLRDVTPPQYRSYPLRVPVNTKEVFAQRYSELPTKTLYTMHKVRKGETVSGIAKKYGVSPFNIIQANSLSKRYRIYPGQLLKILGYGESNLSQKTSTSKDLSESDYNPDKISASKNGYSTYKVKPGDTLEEIAKNFKTTSSDLEQINGINNQDLIKTGEKLKVPSINNANKSQKIVIHKVKRGETLWSIANYFRVPLQKLLEWNSLSDPSYIQIGDRIKIF